MWNAYYMREAIALRKGFFFQFFIISTWHFIKKRNWVENYIIKRKNFCNHRNADENSLSTFMLIIGLRPSTPLQKYLAPLGTLVRASLLMSSKSSWSMMLGCLCEWWQIMMYFLRQKALCLLVKPGHNTFCRRRSQIGMNRSAKVHRTWQQASQVLESLWMSIRLCQTSFLH